jgi:hypothetical protein
LGEFFIILLEIKINTAVHPSQGRTYFGGGVICETRALPGAVIPAKAGIHPASRRKCAFKGLDSRFRGNDRGFERNPFPNDTTTLFWAVNRFA